MLIILTIGGILIILGILMLQTGKNWRNRAGVPEGKVIYTDTDEWRALTQPLLSRRFGLVGKPDYLVESSVRGRQVTIPVEVKSRRRPQQPYDSHIYQLAAYCLLVEDVYQIRPPHGILHYADATLEIPFTEELRRQTLTIVEDIRSASQANDVPRSHENAALCRACGYHHACGADALV